MTNPKLGSETQTLSAENDATPWQNASDGFAGHVVFHLTFSTLVGTLTFMGRPNGSTGSGTAVLAERLETGGFVTQPSADGNYRIDATGMDVRLLLTGYSSGSVAVIRQVAIG